MNQRINKYLASCCGCSRRKAEEMVQAGRVQIDGAAVTDLATTVGKDAVVTLDGNFLEPDTEFVYVLLHKPKGYVTTTSDEKGRKTVLDLIPSKLRGSHRLYPVGRLDYNTEGLLILTNDGNLTSLLTHPKSNVPKVYEARLASFITDADMAKIRRGTSFQGESYSPCKISLIKTDNGQARVRVIITEGKNHQIKNMFASVGREVTFLKRTAIGSLTLRGLDRGSCRLLTKAEINALTTPLATPSKAKTTTQPAAKTENTFTSSPVQKKNIARQAPFKPKTLGARPALINYKSSDARPNKTYASRPNSPNSKTYTSQPAKAKVFSHHPTRAAFTSQPRSVKTNNNAGPTPPKNKTYTQPAPIKTFSQHPTRAANSSRPTSSNTARPTSLNNKTFAERPAQAKNKPYTSRPASPSSKAYTPRPAPANVKTYTSRPSRPTQSTRPPKKGSK